MWLELYLDGSWHRCAELTGTPGDRQQPVQLTYSVDYAMERLFARDFRAVSTRLPVDLGSRRYTTWPAFLIDLLPQGAARRRLERTEGVQLSRTTDELPEFVDGALLVPRFDRRRKDHVERVLDRLHDRNEDHRAKGGRARIDVARTARCMLEFADRLAALPGIMTECDVDAAIVEQRKPEIDRLAKSLTKLRGWQ